MSQREKLVPYKKYLMSKPLYVYRESERIYIEHGGYSNIQYFFI